MYTVYWYAAKCHILLAIISIHIIRHLRGCTVVGVSQLPNRLSSMVSEMVQNSQSLFSFTFNAVIVIHEYIYSHSTTKFTFKKYIYSHLTVYFLFTIIFTHIYEMSSFTFNALYSFTFMIEIFIQHFLRTTFAHHLVPAPAL